jgi:hypothetical protein
MKRYKILSISFSIALVAIMSTSCEFDEQFDIADGGSLAAQLYADLKIPYFYQGTESVTYPIETFANEGLSVTGIAGRKILTAGGVDSTPADYDLTSGQFSQTMEELFADVPVDGEILTEDDLAPGDFWTVSYMITLNDGRTLPIQSARDTQIEFSCVSDIPTEGTWTGTTTQGAFGIISTNPSVTIATSSGAGNYSMSDVTGGFYENFGFARDNPANINDLCNAINITSAPDAQFSINQEPAGPGSWDPVTEILDIAWYDDLNDIHEITIHVRN